MDPITLAQGIADSVGGLFKGIMGFNAGNTQAKALRFAAQQAEAEGGVAASQQVEQGDALAASGAVAAAANGGGLTGSSLGVIQSIANRSMFNARAAAYRGRTQAQADLYKAQVVKADAMNQLIGGVVGSVSMLGGAITKSNAAGQQLALMKQLRGELGGGSAGGGTVYGDGDF